MSLSAPPEVAADKIRPARGIDGIVPRRANSERETGFAFAAVTAERDPCADGGGGKGEIRFEKRQERVESAGLHELQHLRRARRATAAR